MVRFGPLRLAALALLLSASFVEPAWQVVHAIAHGGAAGAGGVQVQGPQATGPSGSAWGAHETDDRHDHPIFQAPLRAAADLSPSPGFVPAMAARLLNDVPARRQRPAGAASARGSPDPAGDSALPRAPPLQ